MNGHIQRVTSVSVLGPSTVRVGFADGVERVIDLGPVLRGQVYGPLADPIEFARVAIDDECGALVWPSGADFDPGTLHDWPEVGVRMVALAAGW